MYLMNLVSEKFYYSGRLCRDFADLGWYDYWNTIITKNSDNGLNGAGSTRYFREKKLEERVC